MICEGSFQENLHYHCTYIVLVFFVLNKESIEVDLFSLDFFSLRCTKYSNCSKSFSMSNFLMETKLHLVEETASGFVLEQKQ